MRPEDYQSGKTPGRVLRRMILQARRISGCLFPHRSKGLAGECRREDDASIGGCGNDRV